MKVRNQCLFFLAKIGLDKNGSGSKRHGKKQQTNKRKKTPEMLKRKRGSSSGQRSACHFDLLSEPFQVQRCKGDEVKSTLCLCDLFSHHFLWGLRRGSKTSWHFGRLRYGLRKKQVFVGNHGKKEEGSLNFALKSRVMG